MTMPNDTGKLMKFLVEEIRAHMRENDLQRDFFESVADQFERNGSVSEKQLDAVNRIYERVTRV